MTDCPPSSVRIPFLLNALPPPDVPAIILERRFVSHLGKLRAAKGIPGADEIHCDPADAIDTCEHNRWRADPETPVAFGQNDWFKIRRRVRRLQEARKAANPFTRLKAEERERLEALRDGVRLASVPNEHRADELAAELHADFPWLAPATEAVWHALRRSVREGLPGVRMRPLLLDGPPGIGKSVWARRLSSLLGTPATVIEASNENASFGIVGSQRAWGGSQPGRVIEDMLRNRVGNPVVVIDEVEKAGSARSTKGHAFDLCAGLLPLLESATATRWTCPFYEQLFDMSWILWVLTANKAELLPEPLLSRCPPIRLRNPTVPELVAFVQREGGRRELSDAAVSALVAVLEHPSLRNHPLNVRTVIRMLERAADLDNRPLLH